MHRHTSEDRPERGFPAAWERRVARVASALGISFEIWTGPAHHGQRWALAGLCRRCQQQEPRSFDRCRKRRAYLTRPEAPVPEQLAEKCPQQLRLAHRGLSAPGMGPHLFAFGYEPHGNAGQMDAAILAFLREVQHLLHQPPQAPEPPAEIVAFLAAADETAPDLAADAVCAWTPQQFVDLCRRSLRAKAAVLGWREHHAVSLGERSTTTPPAAADWAALTRDLVAPAAGPRRQILAADHPVARRFGTPLECLVQPLSPGDEDTAWLVVLRAAAGGPATPRRQRLLQDLASLYGAQTRALRLARTSLATLSDTLLARATAAEANDPRRLGRTRRIRCLALLLATQLQLPDAARAALHWACLRRGSEADPAAAADGTDRVDAVLPGLHDLPWGRESTRILERWSARRDATPDAGSSTGAVDGASECLAVAEAFDDLLGRGGSWRPRSVRAAVAFFEAGAGIAFDAAVVQALGALEPALNRQAWVFLLGRQAAGSAA